MAYDEGLARRVRDALGENAARQDVVITTAAIPGRPAPLLITADAVAGMLRSRLSLDVDDVTRGHVDVEVSDRPVCRAV